MGLAQDDQLPIIRPEQLKTVKKLGEGSFAMVYLAWLSPADGSPRRQVAVKRILPKILTNAVELQLFRREVETLQRLHHRNIVRLIGAGAPTDVAAAKQQQQGWGEAADEPVSFFMQHAQQQLQAPAVPMYLVQEYMAGGPLSRIVSADMARPAWERRGYRLRDSLRWATNIAEALTYLHSRNPKVIHRDLKLSNVLLSSETLSSAEACVADFGLHASVPQQSQSLLAWSSTMLGNAMADGASSHASISWSVAADLTQQPLEQGVAPLPPSIPEAASLRSPFANEHLAAVVLSTPVAASSVPVRQQRTSSGASDGEVRAAASLPSFGAPQPGGGVLTRVNSSKPLSDILVRTMSSRTSKDSSVRSGNAGLNASHTAADVADLQRLFSSSCNSAMQRKGAFAGKTFRREVAVAASSSAAAPADAGQLDDSSTSKWRRSSSSASGGGNSSFRRQLSAGMAQQEDSAAGGGRMSVGSSATLILPAAAEDMRDSITSATAPPAPAAVTASKAAGGVAEAVRQLTARTGSLVYMAPEVFLGRPYDEKADVFSFAIMLWELLHHQLLQLSIAVGAATADAILLYAISMAEDNYRPPINSKLPPALRSLLADCWAADPAARPDMQSVLARLQAVQQELPLQRRSLFSLQSRDGSAVGSAPGNSSSWTTNGSATFSSTRTHSPPPSSSFRPGHAANKDAAAAGDASAISSARAADVDPATQQRGCFGCC